MKYLIILLFILYFWNEIKYYVKVKLGIICEHNYITKNGYAECTKCDHRYLLPPEHWNCRCIIVPIPYDTYKINLDDKSINLNKEMSTD